MMLSIAALLAGALATVGGNPGSWKIEPLYKHSQDPSHMSIPTLHQQYHWSALRLPALVAVRLEGKFMSCLATDV